MVTGAPAAVRVSVILAAAGRGERLGGQPKQWRRLGGAMLVEHSLTACSAVPRVTEIVIVVPDPHAPEARRLQRVGTGIDVRLVPGGQRRQDSVAAGFDVVSSSADVVLVHDAARPFVTTALIERTIDAAADFGAALAAVPVHDTVKQAALVGDRRVVERTLPRETIFLAQTPQAFRRHVLAEAVALGRRGLEATDEAALAELAGHRVHLVEGDPRNVKITTEDDLATKRREGNIERETSFRVGTGYDLHRLAPGRRLVLGGVTLPFHLGPVAHSDGDAICHALIDALLGAANLGDVGGLFPDTDAAWKDADSLKLLENAVVRVREAGWSLVNADVVVVAEQPRIGPYANAMRAALAPVLGVDEQCISIKGKTNEGVDATGRGEAIAAHAVALLARSDP